MHYYCIYYNNNMNIIIIVIASMARAIIFSLVSWANGSSFFLDGVRFRCLLGLPLLGPLLLTPRALLSFGLMNSGALYGECAYFPSIELLLFLFRRDIAIER